MKPSLTTRKTTRRQLGRFANELADRQQLIKTNGVVSFIGDEFPLSEQQEAAMTERLNGLEAAASGSSRPPCVADRGVQRRDLVECHGVAEGGRARAI